LPARTRIRTVSVGTLSVVGTEKLQKVLTEPGYAAGAAVAVPGTSIIEKNRASVAKVAEINFMEISPGVVCGHWVFPLDHTHNL
jgi:hypothetical protein